MKLKNIYTYGGFLAKRNLTIADIIANKGKKKLTLTDATTREEAAACEAVGIDVLSIWDRDVMEVRAGAPNTFVCAGLAMTDYHTNDDILRAAVKVAGAGADMVYTPRGFGVVEMLANEGLSVMGHVGLVPRRSTQVGGLRIIGKTAEEAIRLMEEFRRYEDAGACWVEVEWVASEALEEINKRTKLITHTLGSGSGGDIVFPFLEDLCGDNEKMSGPGTSYSGHLEKRIVQIRTNEPPKGRSCSPTLVSWASSAPPSTRRSTCSWARRPTCPPSRVTTNAATRGATSTLWA